MGRPDVASCSVEQVIELMQGELQFLDWEYLSGTISLGFISRTIDKYPWDLAELLMSPRDPDELLSFVIRHVDKIRTLKHQDYARMLSRINVNDIHLIPEVLQLDWDNIRKRPNCMRLISINPSIDINTIRCFETNWGYISQSYSNPEELLREFPDKVSIRNLFMNPNVSERFVRDNIALLDTISEPGLYCLNLSMEYIKQLIPKYKMIHLHVHPDVTPDMINLPGDMRVYANPGIRILHIIKEANHPDCISWFSQNPNVTPEFVFLNLDLAWNQLRVVPLMPPDIVEQCEAFDIKCLGLHPELTPEMFLRHRSINITPWMIL